MPDSAAATIAANIAAIGRRPSMERLSEFLLGTNCRFLPLASHEGRKQRLRPCRSSSKAAARCDVRNTIGHELRIRYEVSHDLPPEILALLMQLNQRHEAE
jgi:hypothetical protein